MKKYVLIIFCLMSSSALLAYKVKLKKGDVVVDGVKCFEYEKRNAGTELSLYTVESREEMILIYKNDNETSGYYDDDFVQITFIKEQKKFESAAWGNYPFKWHIEKLFDNQVVDFKGQIDSDKLNTFFTKYHEDITNRTIRN